MVSDTAGSISGLPDMEDPLYTEWNNLMQSENVSVQSERCFREIINAYSDPWRYYHNLEHLRKLFSLYRIFKNHLVDPVVTGLSIFYHDLVYKPGWHDNEEKSALLAVERLSELKIPRNKVDEVALFIRATSDHKLPDGGFTSDLPLFLDMDMSILAAPKEEYKQYLWNVRREYHFIDMQIFVNSRREWIKNLLKQRNIFLTKHFESMEEIAAGNLNWELTNGAEWLQEMDVKAS